jgi:hypothetical protein
MHCHSAGAKGFDEQVDRLKPDQRLVDLTAPVQAMLSQGELHAEADAVSMAGVRLITTDASAPQ